MRAVAVIQSDAGCANPLGFDIHKCQCRFGIIHPQQRSRHWTGTRFDVTASSNPVVGGLASAVTYGTTDFSDSRWLEDGLQTPASTHDLYALSGVLTVAPAPVPEPATFALFSLGLLGLSAAQRQKKHAA